MAARIVGIRVDCTICSYMKKPHGRSGPIERMLCDCHCEGYDLDPKPGCLWPGETDEDFGYPCCDAATRPVDANAVT